MKVTTKKLVLGLLFSALMASVSVQLQAAGNPPPPPVPPSDPCTITVVGQTPPVGCACGDGPIAGHYEQCDDSNTVDGDGCSSTCKIEYCGDAVINNPAELCDDGNAIDGDGCETTCQNSFGFTCSNNICLPTCGDGNVVGTEICDDGGAVGGCADDCLSSAPLACSGGSPNGTVEAGEECDGTVCCDSNCRFASSGTSCDDGDSATSSDQCGDSNGVCAGQVDPNQNQGSGSGSSSGSGTGSDPDKVPVPLDSNGGSGGGCSLVSGAQVSATAMNALMLFLVPTVLLRLKKKN